MNPQPLVIGASGLVGTALMEALANSGASAAGAALNASDHPVDIVDGTATSALLSLLNPEVVYLPASLTAVDYCEQRPEESYAVNVRGVHNVVRAVRESGAHLVYFSTDYIFDGCKGPYNESDPPNPLSEYGRHKLVAEHMIATQLQRFLIVRTTVVYGVEPRGKNFVQRLRATLAQGQRLRVPADQIGTPTYAPSLAELVVSLVKAGVTGVINVAGPDLVSRDDFAREAARAFDLDESLIEPVDTASLNQPARRPLKAGLLTDKLAGVLARPAVGYREGLRLMRGMQ